ncbi:Bug family tripartite tricarboxylate transporter substrate binding protein [Parvibium lacunae]|uniref:Tripartite tricarboxylate transporter substrate binding protein BugE n=1 Tax=Parvibium lacunae TaxID=1888893 RepID=A0A368L729_9BURK|nr:tripartite tricarboxylate transporter substrate binding protein BugE [Parvibium lacunae]RCS59470.1 tripartite tricarboxylate transporter substrate binding protein BugE [Parvibium lacunae]
MIKSAVKIVWIALLQAPLTLMAAEYPVKPVKIIVPFAPGGSTDIIGRLIADKLSTALGQPFIVENRAGAGGAIGADALAKASPDGYTLGIASVSTVATVPACNDKLSYDPMKDFTYISNIAGVPNVVTVNPKKLPVKDLAELIKLIKEKPTQYTYASSGTCGVMHMMGELFEESTKTKLTHIPYRGSGPALTDTVGGQVDMMFDNLPSSVPHIQAGNLRALAVASPKRVELFPNVPTFGELGHPLVNEPAWYGLVAPANLPEAITKKLQEAVQKSLTQAEVKAKLQTQGALPIGNSSAEFKQQAEIEYMKMKNIVKTKNIKFND